MSHRQTDNTHVNIELESAKQDSQYEAWGIHDSCCKARFQMPESRNVSVERVPPLRLRGITDEISYPLFVISFTQVGFSKTKFYTQKNDKRHQKHWRCLWKSQMYAVFFSLNLEKFTPERKFLHGHRPWCPWQIWGMWERCLKVPAIHILLLQRVCRVQCGEGKGRSIAQH